MLWTALSAASQHNKEIESSGAAKSLSLLPSLSREGTQGTQVCSISNQHPFKLVICPLLWYRIQYLKFDLLNLIS